MAKLKRPSMLLFIGIPTTVENVTTYAYKLAGVYSDDLSISYNPVTEESQDVTEVASTTDVTGYSLNVPVTTKVVAGSGQKGYDISNYIQGLRRNLATAGDAETKVMIVDTYAPGTTTGTFVAQLFDATIQIDSYGGSASESLGIEYTVNINGEPTTGEATVVEAANGDKTATFS